MAAVENRYQFRNSTNQLHPLEEVLDPITRAELAAIDVKPGYRVLDVGAGAGSIALYLADAVGSSGHVDAVDIDTSLLNPHPNVDIHQRDLRSQPLPGEPESYDVVTARCVLEHLSNRRDVLDQMITLLRPGGRLVLGEIVYASVDVLHAPSESDAEVIPCVVHSILDILAKRGVDLRWGDITARELWSRGMQGVRTQWTSTIWAGGSSGCALWANNATQLRDRLVEHGVANRHVDRFLELMGDPTTAATSYRFASTIAQKPY